MLRFCPAGQLRATPALLVYAVSNQIYVVELVTSDHWFQQFIGGGDGACAVVLHVWRPGR
jgi:hypothetical protein